MSKKLQKNQNFSQKLVHSLFDLADNLEYLDFETKPQNNLEKTVLENKTKKVKNQKNYDLTLFCDGASRGKPPGISSCGIVLFDKKFLVSNGQIEDKTTLESKPIWQKSQKIGITTNNTAEWKALIFGLEYILEKFANNLDQINLQILLDSNLVVQQFNKNWRVKDPNLKILSQKAHKLANQISNISCKHIYRENNFLADQMANLALDE